MSMSPHNSLKYITKKEKVSLLAAVFVVAAPCGDNKNGCEETRERSDILSLQTVNSVLVSPISRKHGCPAIRLKINRVVGWSMA